MTQDQRRYLCARQDRLGAPMYVQDIPHRVRGAFDWGYCSKSAQAMELSHYWMRRFVRDCEAVGTKAFCVEI